MSSCESDLPRKGKLGHAGCAPRDKIKAVYVLLKNYLPYFPPLLAPLNQPSSTVGKFHCPLIPPPLIMARSSRTPIDRKHRLILPWQQLFNHIHPRLAYATQ